MCGGLPACRAGRFVAEEPLHEGVHLRLLRALTASGQQATAVRLYGVSHARLVEYLGVEPGTELRTAYQEVLSRNVLVYGDPGDGHGPACRPRGRPYGCPAGLPWPVAK